MFELGARLAKQGGAALLIDYGHVVTRFGDTLQALRAHRYIDPLVAPGECDLTAHVDFAAMARSASAAGAAVYGPIDQGDFLRAIGIDLRTKALAERATLDHAEEFERARARLVGKGSGRNGRSFQDDGGRRPQAAPAARLPIRQRQVRVSAAQFLTAELLRIPGVAHGFFTRLGGISQGVYASLNGGVGSRDATGGGDREPQPGSPSALGVAPDRLAVPLPNSLARRGRHHRAPIRRARAPAATRW